jgi:arginine repressor
MVNKDLIRHILKEETRDTKSELIRQIKDEGLYSVAELVGGLDNLKKGIQR